MIGVIKAAGAVLLLAVLAFASWWAWDRGLVGGNPRAISVEAMESALLRHFITAQRGAQGGCIAPELAAPRPEVQGQEGIAQRAVAGQFAVTLLVEARSRERELRARQIAQLAYLARHGYFTDAETTVLTDAGPRAGRRFVLTWKGFGELAGPQYGNPCFRIGTSGFEAIESFEKLPHAIAGIEAWTVGYRTAVRDLPEWAATEEAARLFPRLAGRTQPAREKAVLLRGRDGWVSEGEARLQLTDSRQGAGAALSRYVEELRARSSPQAADLGLARAALEQHLASEAWLRRHAIACLPVRLPRGGDERILQPREGPYTLTYYDLPAKERHSYSRTQMVSALHALHALEAAGFARAQPSGRGEVTFGRVTFKASRGVRYSVSPEAIEALGVLRGPACIPAGKLAVEVLALRPGGPGSALVAARARVSDTPDWVLRIAAHLPALKLAIEEGVPVSGQLTYASGQWRVAMLAALYPEIQSHSVPAPLRRHLPQTEAAHPVPAAPAEALPAVR